MAKVYLILFTLLFFNIFDLIKIQARDFKFDRLSVNDGLCSNEVTCIMQDDLGFMWFGTYNGLALYDGYDFEIFQHEPDNPLALPSSTIHYGNVFQKDRFGRLWVGTRSGLTRINTNTREITKIVYDSLHTNILKTYWIQSILIDKRDNIWLGTRGGGLYLLKEAASYKEKFNNFSILHFNHDPDDNNTITNNQIHAIYQDKEGLVWVGTDNGLNCFEFSPSKNSWILKNNNFPQSLQKERIIEIFQDKDGEIWFGVKNRYLHRYKKDKHQFEEIIRPNLFYIQTIAQDSTGFLWFGSWQNTGLIRYNKTQNEFRKIKKDEANPESVSNQLIFDIYISNNNTIWVATYGSGIYYYDPNKYHFHQLSFETKYSQEISGSFIYAILEDRKNKIWMITKSNGVNVLDPSSGKIKKYTHDPNDCHSLSSNSCLSIYEDLSGNIWIGTEWGLNRYVPTIDGFEKFFRIAGERNNPAHISNNWIHAIQQDKDNSYWVATFHGLNRMYLDNGKVEHYWQEPDAPNFESSVIIYNIFLDSQQVLWVSTFNGLFLADKKKKILQRFYVFPDSSFKYNQLINNFLEDNQGNLWLGSRSGLLKLDAARKNIEHYTKKDGLPSNIINSLIDDQYGNLWIGSTKGLTRFNPYDLSVINFDINDGLSGMEFYENAVCKTKNGLLYFGVGHGITVVDPDKIQPNSYIPPVYITSLSLLKSDKKIKKVFKESAEIILNYDQNDFSIEFLALNYTNSLKTQFAYRLEGVDKNWIRCNDRRFVSYANIAPGRYTFRVKGSNNDQLWNEKGTSIEIIILPPWWKTNWAYLLYFSVFVLIVVALRRYDLKRQRLKNELDLQQEHSEKLKEVDHLKSRFFANISHEFRTPLTLLLGPVSRLLEKYSDKEDLQDLRLMQKNARRLQRLINELLDLSKIEEGKLKLQVQKTDILSFIQRIVQTFESQAEIKKINLTFTSKVKTLHLFIDPPKMENVLYNLLSNAFKFTPEGGVVEVSISKPTPPFGHPSREGIESKSPLLGGDLGMGSSIQINVSNTGPVIPPDKIDHIFERFYQIDDSYTRQYEGSGIGLALSKELVELHHGKIEVKSNAESGTTFSIYLPLARAHFRKEEIIDQSILESTETEKENAIKEEKNSGATLPKASAKLLVVEDNADMRSYIKSCFKSEYKIIEAKDGDEGFDKSLDELPDLIISDVMMPKMDGFRMCDQLKTDPRTSHIPVILLTARAETDDKIEGLETGADDYIVKPFEVKELQARVRNLIRQRHVLQQRFMTSEKYMTNELTMTSQDEKFLNRAVTIIENKISDTSFDVDSFVNEIGISRAHLYHKFKTITGQSVKEFIRTIRLKRAAQLIKQNTGNISEISYEVGFSHPAYFTKCFREQFGCSPTQFVN